jgi:hypothetical protein
VPITVTVATTSPSYAISPDFSGLSFGTTSLRGGKNGYFFDSSSTQVLTLFQTLGIRSLRIGGTSVDTNTGNYIPSNPDIDALFRFAPVAGVKVIYSLRLENGDPAQDAATAQYISQNYQSSLANFAIGNEPDLYKHADPKITNFSSYLSDWNSFASTIKSAVPDATFGGPDSSSGTSPNSWGTRFASNEANSGDVIDTHFHYYVGGSSAGQTIQQLIDGMLSAFWVNTDYPAEYSTTGGPVLAAGLPYRFTEADAYYTGGDSGVAGGDNCFATALFALDFMHWWSQHQISGVNFHTSMWKYNGVFYPDSNGNYQVYPTGYGIKAFDLGGHGYVEPLTISNPNGSNVTAYAVGDAQTTYVTIINKTHSPYNNSVDADVTIQLNGVTAASAASITLAGDEPGDGASLTATLGGALIPDNARWQGRWTPLTPASTGNVTVTVPTATAAVVKIRTAGNYAGPIQMNQNGALELFAVNIGHGNGPWHQFGNTEHNAGFGGDIWHTWQTAADVPNSPLTNWNTWTDLAGGVQSKGAAAVVKNLDGTVEVFIPGTNGDVYYNRQLTPSGAWSGWVDMGSSSSGMTDLQAAANADGSLSVFGIGPNGDVWYASQTAPGVGWSDWADLSGEQIRPGFVVGQNLSGALEIFGVDQHFAVWTNLQAADGSWTGWNSLLGEFLNPRLAIAANLDGRLEVFGVDKDGSIWHNWQSSPGGSWNGWSEIAGKRINPGFVVGQNKDGSLMVFGTEASSQNPWEGLGGNKRGGDVWSIAQQTPGGDFADVWTDLGGSHIDPRLVVGNTADGRIQLFGIGANRDVWSNWLSSGTGGWAGWTDFGGKGMEFYPNLPGPGARAINFSH